MLRDLGGDLARDFVVRRGVAAHHLDVDRGGQAEVQNLVGDVGGLEEEDHVGELLVEALAQAVGVLGGGAVVFGFERDQDVAVADAEGRAVAEGEVEAAVGHADVVDDVLDFARRNDLADFVFDFGEDLLGLLDARAGGGAGVQAHGAGIHGREEIAADQRSQAQASRPTNRKNAPSTGSAMIQAPVEQRSCRRRASVRSAG